MITRRMALLLAAVLLAFTGCSLPEQYRVESIQNILVAGVDIDDGQIRLTVVVDKIIGVGPAGESKVGSQVYSATGDTIFDAKRTLSTYTEKRLSWYHLKYIVIGEEAAREDIKRVLDFFSENDENRLRHGLIVAKDMSAAALFAKAVTTEGNFWKYLESLSKETKKSGQSSEVRLLDYVNISGSKWSDPYIPTIQVIPSVKQENTVSKDENQNPAYLTVLSGYALFKNNRLAGYLDGRQAMGLNFVINKLKSAEITLTDIHGQPVSLEVVSSKAKMKTNFSDMPSAAISIEIDTYMLEYHETTGSTNDEYIQYLEVKQNNYIQSLIAEALTEAQRCGTDVFGIGSALHHVHPVSAEKIQDHWKDLFSKMNISVQVESTIKSTYNMYDSVGK